MDRRVVFAGGMLTALAAVYCARTLPVDRVPEGDVSREADEPGLLRTADLHARQILPDPPSRVVATAFPFFGGKSSAAEDTSGPELIMPGEATPSLSAAVPPVIELPSASATPELPNTPAMTAPPVMVTPAPAPPTISLPGMPAPIEVQGPVEGSIQVPVQSPADFGFQSPQAPATELPAEVVAALARVQSLTSYGRSLSERGATYSAQTQFVQALRELAEAYDAASGTMEHTQALNAALRAIEESHDFERRDALSTDPMDIGRIVTGHHTKVLADQDTTQMRPAEAIDLYQQFAIEQLTAAVSHSAAASLPMYGLGRISDAAAVAQHRAVTQDAGDAVVWYQAALQTEPCNAAVAHELGTLYARRGQWQLAKSVLQRAVALKPHPRTWSNLALVHQKLGEDEWARAARSHAGPTGNIVQNDGRIPPVTWVDPATFAKSTGPNEAYFPQQSPPSATAGQPATAAEPRSATKPKVSLSWFPWSKAKQR